MRIAIRADASTAIGTGHVRRCLTLAQDLRAAGSEVLFLMKDHPGALFDLIRREGFACVALSAPDADASPAADDPAHGPWLGCDWTQDAGETAAALTGHDPQGRGWDWLVVDHYALDARWHGALRAQVARIMVMDDLADRPLDCDLLLDSSDVTADADRYAPHLARPTPLLLGPRHALLRPEFQALRAERPASDRTVPERPRLLITYGGVDAVNMTGRALQAVAPLMARLGGLRVVMGSAARHLSEVQAQMAELSGAELLIDTDRMAQLMAEADLALGAGGTTSWERCCLALPTLLTAIADNQAGIARDLARAGAALTTPPAQQCSVEDLRAALIGLLDAPDRLAALASGAAAICDGQGSARVIAALLGAQEEEA